MTDSEARILLLSQETAPDDLLINNKLWKIESTYLTRREALDSATFLDSYKLFKYSHGYVLYERNYDESVPSQIQKIITPLIGL